MPAGRLLRVGFRSAALGKRRSYDVYLPAGYRRDVARGMRFGVLYLLHGNPGNPELYFNAGRVGVDADVALAHHRIRPLLIVVPDGRDGTWRDDTEWADTPHGRYGSLVLDVVHDVDRRFPTIANRAHRVIGGYSMGAYGAIQLTLAHPRIFGAFESWSGYFRQQRQYSFAGADAATLRAASPVDELAAAPVGARPRLPLRAYVYGGDVDPDSAQIPRFVRSLRRAGIATTVRIVPGRHDWAVWRPMVPTMLRWASERMAGR
ncbi:alpha/beta hydrolase [Patulibacter defluvii]|uniref:alpha/beta hydrolase n=1 Tax=Patulibacter defluvii TaxID=3095358 RepID=UPI002A74D18A|nr:alpha/beta hydrolase-fold protein [Patulibacter sp. DM4]